MKKLYNSIFYWIYVWLENPYYTWFREYRASIILSILELLLLLAIMLYTGYFLDLRMTIPTWVNLPLSFLFFGIKPYLIFFKRDEWKKVINDMDKLTGKERKKSLFVVVLIVSTLLLTLFVSIWLSELKRI